MAAKKDNFAAYEEEIDEAEEEALLKSDEESEEARAKTASKGLHLPVESAGGLSDEDSLMTEVVQLAEGKGKKNEDSTKRNSGEDSESSTSPYPANDCIDYYDKEEGDEDDDDDEDDKAEEQILREYKNIVKELEQNQYAYDKYLRLCELAHAADDLDKIRQAYNLFADVYPLTPELWLKYLHTEINVALSPVEIQKVEQIFRRALADYYSPEIALEYSKFVPRTATALRVWQEILSTYGLHCMTGQEFFKRFRLFVSSQSSMSAEEQQNAYLQSFLRELKLPLHNMEESYIEFKVYYERNKPELSQKLEWETVDNDYFKAKEHLQKILPFEQQLKNIDSKDYSARAALYAQYIKDSDKFLDENVLQTVYERMVADCCLNVNCWLTYIDFIEYRDEFGRPEELQEWPVFQQSANDVCNRALRNCTWSEQLYIKRIRLLEQQGRTREEVQEVLESSLSAGFQTAEPAVVIWLEYLTYLRRHTNWEIEGECDILRKNFNLAWTILGQQWGVLADCNCEILQFWGRLEYGPLQDAKRGKELWTTVMESSDNATKSGLWIEFAQLEMRRELDSTRKIYETALRSPGLDNPSVIAAAWERFERCNGTIKSLSACTKECGVLLAAYQQERLKHRSYSDGSKAKPQKSTTDKGRKRKLSSSSTNEIDKEKKVVTNTHTLAKEQKPHETTFKEHENQAIDLTKDHLRIFLSNLDYSLNEEDIRAGLPEIKIVHINLIRSANGRSRGFGYMELENGADVEKALTLDRRTLHGRPLYVSSVLRDKEKRQKFKYSDGLELKKLFIKSLPSDASKEELEQMFAPFGQIKDVRLVYHKSGKFKNIAYVEYEDETAASKAVLSTDQLELRGHNISVAISAPPPKSSTSSAASINVNNVLGISKKRNKVFDQKPRMSLIPNVVRQKFAMPPPPSSSLKLSTQATTNGSGAKTNADFRKLLQQTPISKSTT